MRKILTALILLVVTTFGMSALPATYRSARLYDNPVVMSGSYTGFCQDSEGFVWIGTNRGLLRFDGNAYDVYRHEDSGEGSLSDSRVLSVFCDSKGRVWVATANGLNLYMPDTNTFQVIKIPSKTFYGYIIAVSEQADGTVTFIVSGVGLYVVNFKNDIPEAVKYTYNPESSTFNTIVCCDNGRMYFGVHEGIVYCMSSNGNLTPIKVAHGSYIVALSLESDGNVIVGTLNELYRIKTATNEVTRLSVDGKITINKLSNNFRNKIFVATSDRGLWQIEAGSDVVSSAVEIYCPFVNLHTANIGAVYSAPDDNLWIGCNYKGVVIVPGQQMPFIYLKMADYFSDFGGGISAMAMWGENLVVALDRGTIAVFAPSGKLLKSVSFPQRTYVTSIVLKEDDKALLGVVGDGVWQLDLNTGVLSEFLEIQGKYPLVALARGKNDDIFIGSHGEGLLKYNEKTKAKEWLPYEFGNEKGFSNPFITSLLHSPDDKLWICSYSGLACYDLKTDKMLEVDQLPFLNGSTFVAAPAGESSVLAGTSQGLILYDLKKGVVKKYTIADGLTDNDVRSLAVDGKGGVWIGTVRGLSYLAPGSNKIQSYYGGYGLVENVFNLAVYSKDNDRVYLGNNLGLTSFRPDAVPAPGFDRDVSVSAFYLNGDRLGRKAKDGIHDVIVGSAVSPDELNLPFQNNALTLRLSTMDFRDASNICYMWRLNPKDDWIQAPPGENLIYLPHLDPGSYDFEVCAYENNTMSAPTHIKIRISSPWYWNTWSKIIYAIIVVSILWLGWMALKKKRDDKITEEKIKFFMDISHDLRSPLTLILNPLESLMKQPFDEDVKIKLHTMHRNVYRMLSLVNQLLDIRKLEKGKMNLHCKLTDMNSFVGELVEMFRPQAEDKNLTITFYGWTEERKVWIDHEKFDKIMVNIISNAIKYTPKGGEIEIKVEEVEDAKLGKCVSVSVKDNGIGLDAKTEARLFERFYRVEKDDAHPTIGFGIGLDLCRRLVMLHHGNISGKNRGDGVNGSIFTVLIPLDERLYKEEELMKKMSETKEIKADRKLSDSGSSPTGELTEMSSTFTSGKYILFVDDDNEMCNYVSMQLGRIYKVKTASNGAEALKMIADKTPDIIISDVKMPEMDGLTLLKRLKTNVETSHIPVVLLSSKNDIADRMAGWDKGADGYLGKPFNIDELQMLVGTLIMNRQRMKGKYSGAQETEGKILAPEVKGNDEMLMDRILKEINSHIDDPQLNVESLSEGVGVSRTHLHRKMKELVGLTPGDYIRNVRLKRACELLKRGDIEVTQVAYKIGFASPSHFSTHFKRYTGYSPSEYRAKELEKENR